jgi:hypothetical protein
MAAYYYSFDETGVDAIDIVLSAVACAGKAFHHTEEWQDADSHPDLEPYEPEHRGDSPAQWINNAAFDAAESFRKQTADAEQRGYERGRAEERAAVVAYLKASEVYDREQASQLKTEAGRAIWLVSADHNKSLAAHFECGAHAEAKP